MDKKKSGSSITLVILKNIGTSFCRKQTGRICLNILNGVKDG